MLGGESGGSAAQPAHLSDPLLCCRDGLPGLPFGSCSSVKKVEEEEEEEEAACWLAAPFTSARNEEITLTGR